MKRSEDNYNYERIAKAISFIIEEHSSHPSLEEIAAQVCLSPFHFQRLFIEWAGTTPKKFLQYVSLSHAKSLLLKNNITETTYQTGLSSTSRLHDLFVRIEGMTPAEYKNGGEHLTIKYSESSSPFGQLLVASTDKGICHISFIDDNKSASNILESHFPKAFFLNEKIASHNEVLKVISNKIAVDTPIKLHVKGTPFQLKVWEALLKIPYARLTSYGQIALQIKSPNASRAVGTAIANNPIAYLIPCHRVIQASGVIGGYMWNPIRKRAIIAFESIQSNHNNNETI